MVKKSLRLSVSLPTKTMGDSNLLISLHEEQAANAALSSLLDADACSAENNFFIFVLFFFQSYYARGRHNGGSSLRRKRILKRRGYVVLVV